MTAATEGADPVWVFINALPSRVRRQLNRTQQLVVLVHAATRDHDWDPAQLGKQCGDHLGGAVNDSAVVMARLKARADRDPDIEEKPRRVHFGCCDGGWIYPDDGEPIKCGGNRAEVDA